ncbi:MCE family protein [Mycobacterium sp. pUA109]|uniref:MCE family protein n=1 Tax=Mycobacterium sp. pUA109 TaxID=3238982 RepID=UPI00351B843F
MTRTAPVAVKFGAFAAVMLTATILLFLVFEGFRSGPTAGYSAVFADASGLRAGDSVRVAGVRVGTVDRVVLRDDNTALVHFDADREVVLTTGTTVAVKYLNLVGDRYLELADGPGSTQVLSRGAQIPVARTRPALDLDLLLGGLRPVIRGLDPQDVNALTSALLQIFQGQSDTIGSLLSKTSSFSSTLADHNDVIEQVIDNLNTVLATLGKDGEKFSGALDRFTRLVGELSSERDMIGAAIESLSNGTASVAELLGNGRPALAAAVDQLNRLGPLIDQDKGLIDASLQRAPDNFRKLARTGAYGSFVNYYLCGVSVRASDLQGRTVVFPWFKQETGRCAEP